MTTTFVTDSAGRPPVFEIEMAKRILYRVQTPNHDRARLSAVPIASTPALLGVPRLTGVDSRQKV
jgi:hypothetical protein